VLQDILYDFKGKITLSMSNPKKLIITFH